MTKIMIRPVDGTCDLYRKYQTQMEPQPCYVELDCRTGVLQATWNAEIGNAVPFSVWHGHEHRWSIPTLTAVAANEFLAELVEPCQRIIDGYTSEWDGHNLVARYTQDAWDAIDVVSRMAEQDWDQDDQVQAWDAGDWIQGTDLGITADTTNERLSEIAKEVESELDSNVIVSGVQEYLESLRDKLKEEEVEIE